MSSPPSSSQEAPSSWQLFQEQGSGISQPALYSDANPFFDPRMYVDPDISSSSKGFANSDQYDLWLLAQQISASLSLDEEERNVSVNQGGVRSDSDIIFHQGNSRLLEEVNRDKLPDNKMNVSTGAREITFTVSRSFSGKSNVKAEEDSTVKKQEHNARERERRMRLSSSYLTLRSLLPNSRRSKKRWSSSTIIEKVLEYIPCLEKEIQNLTHKKNEVLATIKSDNKNINDNEAPEDRFESAPAVSVVEIKGVEVIIQIYMKRWSHGKDAFSSLIKKLEEQGLKILSASTVLVSDHRLSCHLHIQLEDGRGKAGDDDEDKFPIFREKVLSWLRSSSSLE